ncbi:MAG: hypothetical protein AB1742_15685 [bacterium]
MSIRSVDLQILFSKTSDVERAQQIQQQHDRVVQQQVTDENVAKKVAQQTQVVSTPRPEGGRIEERPERRRGRRRGRERPAPAPQQPPQPPPLTPDPLGKGKIDIRI